MNKRLLKVAITTALTVAFAVPAFANPFTDVPAKHWAYDAVNKLAQAGVITGYGDGTFKGDKTVSRYEMASMVATAMQKNLNGDQKAIVDKLSKEFAAELIGMGIKVDSLDKKVDNMVKISGDARVRYFQADGVKDNEDYADYRARVTFDGKINNNMKFSARLTSGSALSDDKAPGILLDTANVGFSAFGLNNTVGRQDIKLGSGYLMDAQMNGIASQVGGFKVFAGNASSNAKVDTASAYANGATSTATVWNRVVGAEYGTNLMGAKFTADYLQDNSSNDKFIGANAGFRLVDGVTANVEYFKNSGDNKNDATAKAYGVKFDNLGLSATYRNVEANAVTPFSTMFTSTNSQYLDLDGGFKGMEYQYDRALDKNAALTVKYQDFKTQDGTKLPARTSAVVNVKF